MNARLVPTYEVTRERLLEAVTQFPSDEERSDFIGGEPLDLAADGPFEALCRTWRREEQEHCEQRPAGMVPQTRLVLIDGERVVAQVGIRHRLTNALRLFGGHIGYAVVPSTRRRGYGSRALELALPVAQGIGIETVLVTCHHANEPSRRIIEKVGGLLVDRCGDRLRFVLRPDGGPPSTEIDELR